LDSPQILTAAEQQMASIWSEVLGCEVSDPMANFMDLGGSSLLAAQVARAASDRFGIKIIVVDVIVAPSLREFVGEIEDALLNRPSSAGGCFA
jgi:hypothetical protein